MGGELFLVVSRLDFVRHLVDQRVYALVHIIRGNVVLDKKVVDFVGAAEIRVFYFGLVHRRQRSQEFIFGGVAVFLAFGRRSDGAFRNGLQTV